MEIQCACAENASLADDIKTLSVVRECRSLEQHFGVDYTILQDDGGSCLHQRDTVKDRELLLSKHQGRADMSVVVEVERAIGWPRLWDLALDNGARCIQGMKNLVRVITFPHHALNACPLCEREDISRDSLLCHVLDTRQSFQLPLQQNGTPTRNFIGH